MEAEFKECFSQNKDELILVLEKKDQSKFFIKAHLKSDFSCLSFPQKFERAKKNSIDLFADVIGRKVTKIKMHENERAFSVHFDKHLLLFKLFGNRANIILFNNKTVLEVFRSKLKRDAEVNLTELDRVLDVSFENLDKNEWDIKTVIPTLDKLSAQIFLDRLANRSEDKKRVFEAFFKELNDQNYYIIKNVNGYKLSLLKPEVIFEQFTNPILAINSFFEKQIKYKVLGSLKSKILTQLNGQFIKSNNYIKKANKKLKELSEGGSNQQMADILMANLHVIDKGRKSVELQNFYNNSTIAIKLNPLFSPQKNAERYYRKAKNESKEITILKKNIGEKSETVNKLKIKIIEVEKCESIKTLQKWIPKPNKPTEIIHLPYKEFIFDGYKILVGKNAKHNDTLTLKIAKKDDLWLHAKDVSGSHVVIKQIAGRNYPTYIIEKAAQLAAFYSKRKTDSLCPVIYTPKKFVRKKKGTPAGAVFVEKEKVLLVEPSNLQL